MKRYILISKNHNQWDFNGEFHSMSDVKKNYKIIDAKKGKEIDSLNKLIGKEINSIKKAFEELANFFKKGPDLKL